MCKYGSTRDTSLHESTLFDAPEHAGGTDGLIQYKKALLSDHLQD